MMWEVSREQEELFRKGIPKKVDGIDTEDLFKLIRGSEYRRGKEDEGLAQKAEFEKLCKCGHREGMHSNAGCWFKQDGSEEMCMCKQFNGGGEK